MVGSRPAVRSGVSEELAYPGELAPLRSIKFKDEGYTIAVLMSLVDKDDLYVCLLLNWYKGGFHVSSDYVVI